MKNSKLILFSISVIVLLLLQSFTVPFFNSEDFSKYEKKSTEETFRPWWATALVDAGGALGGAGSVASFPGGAACHICVGIGAIVGGAGASLAMPAPNGPTPNSIAPYPGNEYDYIGIKHNSIVLGFLNEKISVTPQNYYNYVKNLYVNDAKSMEAFKYYKLSDIEKEMAFAKTVNTVEDALSYVSQRLPSTIDKSKFKSMVSKLFTSETSGNLIDRIKIAEDQFFKSNNLKKESDIIALKAFFSVLRNSTALWNDSRK